MKKQNDKQTAYLHNAASSFFSNTFDHGWTDAINRMIDQRYAFLGLQYENKGNLFRGMSSGLFESLLSNNFWHYAAQDSCSVLEKNLDVLFLSQDFSDAYTQSKIWEQKVDACIVILESDLFNNALKKKQAAVMATAEPGMVFKYPFISHPLNMDEIQLLIVSKNILKITSDKATINDLDISERGFIKLKKIISALDSSGKLIYVNPKQESFERSHLEGFILQKLIENHIFGAKTVKSNLKPRRKT